MKANCKEVEHFFEITLISKNSSVYKWLQDTYSGVEKMIKNKLINIKIRFNIK